MDVHFPYFRLWLEYFCFVVSEGTGTSVYVFQNHSSIGINIHETI